MAGSVSPATPRAPGPYRVRTALAGLVFLLGALSSVIGGCPIARFAHLPCPGCGMTRASLLMLRGEVTASLGMHALALPTLCVQLAWVAMTLWLTYRRGHPFEVLRNRAGRVLLWASMAVTVLVVGLWGARLAGHFGGPAPVSPSTPSPPSPPSDTGAAP